MTFQQKTSIKGLTIWGLCAFFFTYEFLLRTVLGTFEHPLLEDLNLTFFTFSLLSSTAYQTIYGFMQVPAGILFDKFGLKIILTIAVSLCSVAVIGFALTHSFDSALIFRILMGFGSSFGFIGLLIAVYDWMPSHKTGLFIGLSQFIGTLGPMIGAGPLNALSESGNVSWRVVFIGLAIIGLILTISIYIIVENNRDYTGSFQILKRPKPLNKMFIELISQRQVWIIGLYSAAIYFTIEYLSENSGKAFLLLHGYSSQTASNMITLSWLGYAIGCPLLGYISDLAGRRKAILVSASLICFVAGILIIYFASYLFLLGTGFFCLGIGASGQSVAFAAMAEQCEESYLAAGLGFNNACIVILSAGNAPLIATLLDHFSTAEQSSLSITHYQNAFLVLLFTMLVAIISSVFFIKETFCKSTKSATQLHY